ncbi:MAG: ATP-binding protein [Chloroflexi bacterium]|nr:ATP-binding protein [Chloroflexota bacterium]
MKSRLSFRTQLLLAQILPVVILVSLIGFALTYLFESQVIVPTLANEMIDQGLLVARLTQDHPSVWKSNPEAQILLDSTMFQRPTRIGLLSVDHILLATSRPDDLSQVGTILGDLPDTKTLTQPWWAITTVVKTSEKILDVIVPVRQTGGKLIGLVRVYRRMADVEQGISKMRLLILAVVLGSSLLAGITAFFLFRSITKPLNKYSQAIMTTPLEGPVEYIPEEPNNEFSELAHAYNQLQHRRMELENTRQQMLANLIHEMGRPLGSLRTALHALQTGAIEDISLRIELMNGMSERIDRMGRLLDDLALIYRKLEPYEIHPRPIIIQEWLQSLMPLWAENARQKQIIWETYLAIENIQLVTDPDRLAQVLSNLVNNAVKFTQDGGKITFRVIAVEDKIQFNIQDTGIGIPQGDQQHLFTPFYRSVQPSWKTPGLGLGLSIAKSITESLGGEISVFSIPDQGSTFIVTLPARAF